MKRIAVLLALVPFCASADTMQGTVVRIADGDTLTILDASKRERHVRVAQIDAPQRGQPFGTQSRQSLAGLCLRKPALVEWQERDKHKRYVGRVTCAGVDAGAEQVRRGMAWVSPRFTEAGSPLYELEAYARLRALGLWADSRAIPPWEWQASKAAR
jgi:endonuclease YncB( thermonuclease family)